ncbi:MAG: redoxin domain-containing protein [Dehalococcoidia bacterium]
MTSQTTLREGAPAPDFTLLTNTNETVTLSEQRGSPVVLTTFVLAFQDEDREQLRGFEAQREAFEAAGAKVYGLSADPGATHRAWVERGQITLPLLSDFRERTMMAAYGLTDPETGTMVRRTFVLDQDGIVRKVIVSDQVADHAAQALEAVRAL